MSPAEAPTATSTAKPRCSVTWRILTAVCLVFVSLLGYTAFALRQTYMVNAAHVRIGIIGSQLQMFAQRAHPEKLTLESALTLLRKDHQYIASDGSGHYNLKLLGDQFVLFTSVMSEGFFLERVVVVYTTDKGSEALQESKFLIKMKAGDF